MSETSTNSSNPSGIAVESTPNPSSGDLQNINPSYRLNGRNYLQWSQIVRTFLKGRGKLNHLIGAAPKSEDPKFATWDEEDSMIMSWLWNSMQPKISGNCMFLTTAQEIWESVRQTYSKMKDAALMYEIKTKISSTKQGTRSVTEYYNLMKSFWLELDHYQSIKMKCSDDAVMLKNFVEKDRIFEFIAGLNAEFDQIRIQLLGRETLPSLSETFSIIRAEESRRTVMLNSHTLEGSAMISTKFRGEANQGHNVKSENKETEYSKPLNRDKMWCSHCKKPRHTIENCFKLHGKAQVLSRIAGLKGQQRGQTHFTNGEGSAQEKLTFKSDEIGLNKEEIDKLRNLLNSLSELSSACSLAQSEKDFEKDKDDTKEFLELDSLPKSGPLPLVKKFVSPNPQNPPEISHENSPIALPEMEREPIYETQLEKQQPGVKSIAPLQVYSRKRVPISELKQIHAPIHESEPGTESETDYLYNTGASSPP
ncbi:hypothetical protein Salat_0102900 [Sesamum alatum]|uniref:Retrotransposon gag domain-containing protein n=1 Tax=Sesamum alatum TaxID=300844 RepID=A0AAE2CXH2_9LAMI|nr:hypothetical protein Salat_0102900 [Sesamum alatum]